MKNRKYLVVLFLAVAFILTPVLANAQTPTIAELQAQIAALQRQLAILLGQQDNTGIWCHTFNTNLSINMSGSEVTALQTALTRAGFGVNASGSYDENTAAAVSGFQLRYQSEILTPLGLIAPTGYFGPSTRAVMNRLYGCGNAMVPPPPATARYTLTTAITGVLGSGSGTITRSPNQTSYAAGTVVTLTATPSTGSTFVGWSGNLTHLVSPATITMNGNKSVTAIFTAASTLPPPAVTLRGFQLRITDQTTSAGLAGVTVTINRGGTYVATQTTGSDGWTPAISLRVGESHTFSFSKTGYQNRSAISMTIPAGTVIYTYGPVPLAAESASPPVTPSLTVTSPSTNSSWTASNGPVIQWSSANIPSGNQITVELLTPSNGQVPGWSNFSTANDGSESGRLTNSSIASGSYYFRLSTVVNGQTVYGGSGVFQFTGAIQPPPTATTYQVTVGVKDVNTGTMISGATVRVSGNGLDRILTAANGQTSTYVPAGSYTLTVSATNYQTQTQAITIINSGYNWQPSLTPTATAAPSFTVTSPANNSSWTASNGPVIQWSSANIPSGNQITVELLTPSNGQVPGWSNFSTANDGSESGRLTNSSVASGWYYFRLSTVVNGQTIYGGSGVFQFTAAPAATTYTLSIGNVGTGSGTVTSSPVGINCGTDCSENYATGATVTLTAQAGSGSTFAGWSQGGCSGTATTCTVTMNVAKIVVATFTYTPAASISISSPTASSRWTPTAFTHSVVWTSSNIPSSQFLTMELMTPTNTRVNAFTPVSSVNDGNQAVNISNITPGYYWFRLTATVNGQTIYGGSSVFQIVSN